MQIKPQPIETAPKDGTEFLGFGVFRWTDFGDWSKPCWRTVYGDEYGWATKTENPYEDEARLTHWMPLPVAPDAVMTDIPAPPTTEK